MEDARQHAIGPPPFPNKAQAPAPARPALEATIRVLLADPRPLVLGALADLIDRQRPRMEAVGGAGSHARAVSLAEREQPDVVLLSVLQDTLAALGTVAALARVCSARVLLLKDVHDPVPAARLLRSGAAGIVGAQEPTESIVNAVVRVHEAGELQPRAPVLPAVGSSRVPSDGVSRLTERERELVRTILDNPGAKYLVIGARLGISEHTVHNHLSSIYQKLNLVNRTDLLFYAVRNGLVEPSAAIRPHLN